MIRGGIVYDGSGGPAARADVGVTGGRIAEVGDLSAARAEREIDAAGRHVLPGFVDAHVHGETAVHDPAVQLAALRQGVTTFVLGQDGLSFAPAGPATLRYVNRYFAAVNGRHPGDAPVTVAGLLASYHRRTRLNTAYLVPHGTLRYEVMGPAERAPDAAELAAMERLLDRGLEEGAAGVSTGLEYAPGRYAQVPELAALARRAAARGLPYVTHMRGYETAAPAAMAEVREIALASGAAAHVSHYHGPADDLIADVDRLRGEGVDLTYDSYPYLRGCSILSMVTLPPWIPVADVDAAVAALADPAVRDRLDREWFAARPEVWPRVTLSHVPSEEYAWAEGLAFPEAAERAGMPPGRFCCELLVATELEAGCVFGQPPTNSEESVRALMRHEAHVGGSDGIYAGGHPHPRGWGAFARYLRRHVVELGDWTWERAAVHLASRTADRFGLSDRGRVRRGAAADLVVLDPAAIADAATYENPREPAIGVDHVLVNGEVVLTGGALAAALPGEALTPSGSRP
ncbi:D-aminoacylase [Bailinhaonella thermotolerans]|uniref:D-aminoacylase n=1 Tax=Bailinhaonella thermotolerans TaxID=1070861 RepID=A0A3A4B8W4_9ACTN|nr:D-aminoacylase [Bailinhaonella thermotolerans]